MTARIGVVVFPGTNCEHDTALAIERAGGSAELRWHADAHVGDVDAVVLPGGFAHGDYLRAGAIARFSPVMGAVSRFAAEGGTVIGICNGFQVLTEAGLLPGALMKNRGLRFVCKPVAVKVTSSRAALCAQVPVGTELTMPVNHFMGAYVCDDETLGALTDRGQVVLRYVENPNGSLDDIAGVSNEQGNVVGLMPHPERASDPLLGSTDGLVLLRSLVAAVGDGALGVADVTGPAAAIS